MYGMHPDFSRALRAAQTGDNGAFTDLWRITNPTLLRYLQITAPEVASDAASATWVKIARGLRGFGGDQRAFTSLLVRIARDEAKVRRRNSRRRPDRIIDIVALESATRTAAAGVSGAARRDAIASEQVVALLSRLHPEVAEMVALRVVVGWTAAETAALLGQRRGSVIVAVHGGLRRTSNLLGLSGLEAAAGAPLAAPNPWVLDQVLDRRWVTEPAATTDQLDHGLHTVVAALSAPCVPGDVAELTPAQFAFERSLHRSHVVVPAFLLPLLAKRLGLARSFLTGKVTAVVVGTAVLSAPAAVAYSGPLPLGSSRSSASSGSAVAAVAAADPAGRDPLARLLLAGAAPAAPPAARAVVQPRPANATARDRSTAKAKAKATETATETATVQGKVTAKIATGPSRAAGPPRHPAAQPVNRHHDRYHRHHQHHRHDRRHDRPWWWWVYLLQRR